MSSSPISTSTTPLPMPSVSPTPPMPGAPDEERISQDNLDQKVDSVQRKKMVRQMTSVKLNDRLVKKFGGHRRVVTLEAYVPEGRAASPDPITAPPLSPKPKGCCFWG